MENLMIKIIKLNLIISLIVTTNNAFSEICRSETDIPSTTPSSRFNNNSNGTVSDNRTKLMWQKCQLGLSGENCEIGTATLHNWQQALDEAESNTNAGYSDWRLPNHKELLSIVEQRCYNPSINSTIFPNTSPVPYFWSASPDANQTFSAWGVSFRYGFSRDGFRDYNLNVRLVRFGQ